MHTFLELLSKTLVTFMLIYKEFIKCPCLRVIMMVGKDQGVIIKLSQLIMFYSHYSFLFFGYYY